MKKKLRILHFGGNYFPVPSGSTIRISGMLGSPENEHYLCVPWPRAHELPTDVKNIQPVEQQGHIHIHRTRFPQDRRWYGKIPIYGNYLRSKEFLKAAPEENIDILHGHTPMASAFASLAYRQQTGTPMVFEVHGLMGENQNHPNLFGPIKRLTRLSHATFNQLIRIFEKKILRSANHIIVQTDIVKNSLEKSYKLKHIPVTVIRNGVDSAKFNPAHYQNQRHQLRQKHKWDDQIVCMYAGYLDQINGIHFLIESLTEQPELKKRIKFVVLGRGPLRDKTEQFSRANPALMEFLGPVDFREMPAYYAACDIFMIPRPSYLQSENLLPMKLFEAMAMEKPVLVSDVRAMAEVIKDGENGLLFHKGDTQDFLRKIRIITEDDIDLTALGYQARRDVLNKYTWKVAQNALQTIYRDLSRLHQK